MDIIQKSQILLQVSANYSRIIQKKLAQEIERTDPVMDLVEKYKEKILQTAADASVGKSVRNVDIYFNFDGSTINFVVEAEGNDAKDYNLMLTNILNKNYKQLMLQATALLKKEKIGPMKFRILEGLNFSQLD